MNKEIQNDEKVFVNRVISILAEQKTVQLDSVRNVLDLVLNDYDVKLRECSLAIIDTDSRTRIIQNFLVAKKVEGRADSSLRQYNYQLVQFFGIIDKKVDEVTTNDIRFYLAKRQIDNSGISKVTLNNERRILNSFFSWCQAENYIVKNPMAAVGMIKQPKRIKKAFSEIEMEKLREACKTNRDKAMIEVLYSTGVRCHELVRIRLEDIDGDQISVIGKGDKERFVYLNAKSIVAIKKYLETRNNEGEYLFENQKKPFGKMSKGNVERVIREIGDAAGVKNTHPHRFRRTAATLALNRGMPIEQVQQMLGHENIGTTTLYARSELENVKASHRKYVV